tara:strand:+ start:328 stop:609 length:282 start_codon:yes stop_codon:yes gene_type:complete
MAKWSKQDTTKATSYKRGDVKIEHNIYDLVGTNLFRAFEEGKLSRQQLNDMLKQISLEAKVDLGKGYRVGLGYNMPSENRTDEYRIKLTKDLY